MPHVSEKPVSAVETGGGALSCYVKNGWEDSYVFQGRAYLSTFDIELLSMVKYLAS